jgi:hypothetical protein
VKKRKENLVSVVLLANQILSRALENYFPKTLKMNE